MSEKKQVFERLRACSQPPDFEGLGVPDEVVSVFSQAMGKWIVDDCHGFWMEPDSGDGHCDPDDFVETIGMRVGELTNAYCADKPFGSPIEAKLFAALLWLDVDWAGMPKFDMFRSNEGGAPFPPVDGQLEFLITPQAEVAGYRVDLLMWFQCGRARGGIAIECDGHDFHEKTKEQAARDKKRDREILAAGFPVVRFTGSEIYRSPTGCAEQVRDLLASALFRVSKDGGLI